MNIYTYDMNIGSCTIASDDNAIVMVKLNYSLVSDGFNISYVNKPSRLTDLAAVQLEEYFSEKRREFDLPLNPSGTGFQKTVWEVLTKIPYGETRSYKQIAQMIGKPKAYRAVGMANNKNPIWIIIPCHRVIGSNGSLVGYGGGLDIKRRLLQLENTSF